MKAEADIAVPVTFWHRVPAKPLADFIELLWYWRGYEQPYAKERLMPMPTVELVIELGSPRGSDSSISGPRSESLIIERSAEDELLGVHFKPGGAFPFLGFPFADLHNNSITLADLWGEKRAARLLHLLNEARTVELKFQLLEKWFMWIANRPLKHHPAVVFAISEFEKNPQLTSSADVAQKTGFSQRRFIELFRDEVGMTPKLFCRVQRFHDVITRIQYQNDVDWVDLSLSFGYSDQSHFIHEFREFSGLTPTKYLGLRTGHLSHVQFPE
jgi:AraC-like DNA-binding protein